MAEYTHSIDRRTTPAPARAAVDRRSVGAALLAIVAGSGITAEIAASAADLVPAGSDVGLIEACRRAHEADAQSSALIAPFYESVRSEESEPFYEAAHALVADVYHPSIALAASLPAMTHEGLLTKALLLLRTLEDPEGEDALAASLARDVLAGRA